jgi:hypothetical protein
MTKWILAAALIVSALQSTAIAQSKDTLVGTWRLISSKDMTEKGEVKTRTARIPQDSYTADGRMMVIISNNAAGE